MKYYHLSPIENKESILDTGLHSNEGIFLFTNIEQAIHIATNQLGINEYSIFEVSKAGITGNLSNDNVADFGSEHQWILKQELVEAKYITFIKDESFNMYDSINEAEAKKFKAYGYSEEQIINMMRCFPERLARYNEVNGTNLTPLKSIEFNPDIH